MVKKFLKDNQNHFHFIFRLIVGLLFMLHGFGKWDAIQSMSFNLMFFAGVIEILGGAFVLLGLYTRISALVCSLEMAYAFVFIHVFSKNGFNINPLTNGGELSLLFLVSFLVIAATGPTSWSAHKD